MSIMDEEMYEKKEKEEEKLCGKKASVFSLFLKKDNFLVMILIGILLLVIVWPVDTKEEKKDTELWEMQEDVKEQASDTYSVLKSSKEILGDDAEKAMLAYAGYLEETLEEVLSSMEGAGKVKVMVTLESSGEAVIEKDVMIQRAGTTEVDAAGGSRNTTDISEQEETVFEESKEHIQRPYVKRIDAPRVKGVLIAVQGGHNANVVKNITEAIQALFGIEAHKIKIVKMNSQ